MAGIASFALMLLEYVPIAIQGVNKAIELIEWGTPLVRSMVDENRDPTDEEWDALNAKIAELRADLHEDDPNFSA